MKVQKVFETPFLPNFKCCQPVIFSLRKVYSAQSEENLKEDEIFFGNWFELLYYLKCANVFCVENKISYTVKFPDREEGSIKIYKAGSPIGAVTLPLAPQIAPFIKKIMQVIYS